MRFAFAIAVLISAVPAAAQFSPRTGELPILNMESEVTVGGNLYETFNYSVASGVHVNDELRAVARDGRVLSIPANTVLYLYRDDRRPKACVKVPAMYVMQNPCAIDMDNDGDFDRIAWNEVAGAMDLNPSVPYTRGADFISTFAAGSFRNVLIYQGFAQSVLRVSYREFSNDYARPAFTEEYTFELGNDFPQEVVIRSKRFRILSVGPTGMRFLRLN